MIKKNRNITKKYNEILLNIYHHLIQEIIDHNEKCKESIELQNELAKLISTLTLTKHDYLTVLKANITKTFKHLSSDEVDDLITLNFYLKKSTDPDVDYYGFELEEKFEDQIVSERVIDILLLHCPNSIISADYLEGILYPIHKFEFAVVKRFLYNFLNFNLTNKIIYNFDDKLDFPEIYSFPFNCNEHLPLIPYPRIYNNIELPLFNNKYLYEKVTCSASQQIEISTNTHSAYYYRKASAYYSITKEGIKSAISDSFKKKFNKELHTNIFNELFDLNKITQLKILEKKLYSNMDKTELSFLMFYILKLKKIKLFIKPSDLSKIGNLICNDPIIDSNILNSNLELKFDKDLNCNDIPIYYRIINYKKVLTYDLEGNDLIPTNFIVAKSMLNEKRKISAIDFNTVQNEGIEDILNNDIDFPIERGLYHIDTPNVIYFPPEESHINKKGVFSYDEKVYRRFIKKMKVFYIPEEDFVVPENRVLFGLPALCYSYIITHLSIKDKIKILKKLK